MGLKKYYAFGLTIASEVNFDGVLTEVNTSPDVWIKLGKISESPQRKTKIYRQGMNACFGLKDEALILNWNNILKFKIRCGSEIIVDANNVDLISLQIFTLSEALGMILWQRGIFLLHGSAVFKNKESTVICGVSGAGKSTTALAFNRENYSVLTDDLVAIQKINNEFYVIPAFDQLKIWADGLEGFDITKDDLDRSSEGTNKYLIKSAQNSSKTGPVPLKNILFLKKSSKTQSLIKLEAKEVLSKLTAYFPLPTALLKKDGLIKHFIFSSGLAKSIQAYDFYRPKDISSLIQFVRTFKD